MTSTNAHARKWSVACRANHHLLKLRLKDGTRDIGCQRENAFWITFPVGSASGHFRRRAIYSNTGEQMTELVRRLISRVVLVALAE